MNSTLCEFFEKPTSRLIPLYASFKNVYVNGVFSTKLYHTTKYQIIYVNNVPLKTKYLYNQLNSLLSATLFNGRLKDKFFNSNKHFVYFVKINYRLDEGNICSKNGKPTNRYKIISNVINCLALLVKNLLVILKCMNLSENCNICDEVDYNESSMSIGPGKFPNVKKRVTNSAFLFKKHIPILERLGDSQFQPLENIINYTYLRSIGKLFEKWFNYEIAISFLLSSRKLFKRRTSNCEYNALFLENGKNLNVQPNTSISRDIFGPTDNTLSREAFKSIEEETLLKPLQYDISTFSYFPITHPKIFHTTNQENVVGNNNFDVLNRELQKEKICSNRSIDVIPQISVKDSLHFKNTISATKQVCYNNHFITADRNIYIPKGMSPVMNIIHKSSEISSKAIKIDQSCGIKDYRIENDKISKIVVEFSQNCPKNMTHFFQRETFTSFDKSFFKEINVIGQVDNKYIICDGFLDDQHSKPGKYLFVLDQHAVDERIQLEKLLSRFMDSTTEGHFRTHFLKDELILDELMNEDITTALQFSNYFIRYGMHLKETAYHRLEVKAVPEFLHWLATKRTSNVYDYYNFMKMTVNVIVLEQLTSVKETGNVTNTIPSVLYKYFCREACLVAVNFGKKLSFSCCEKIVKNIADCLLPFMCAHGRPVICFLREITSYSSVGLPPTLTSLRILH